MKVHIILNSHLDPVWLWTWPQGLDEVLATARTACDLIEAYPEIVITRGEAWFYAMIREIDPTLFQRVKNHVATGHLQVVGGWWIQPDCNLPTAEAFRKQAELSAAFFREHFNTAVTVGYNVDSFGHAATLPDFYAAAGIDSYVMMRPQKHEKELPANLFVWESPSGRSVTTFRISCSYCTTGDLANIARNIDESIADASDEVGHTMCFVGVGNHGGGPARQEIEWLREHLNYRPGVELVFSHPRAFFDAVRESGVKLPVVKDELQHHAVGCYSVVHRIKQEVRRAEELAMQAENVIQTMPNLIPTDSRARLDDAWKKIIFNQFHDILAGSSIKPAYEHAYDELGAAKADARAIVVAATRKMNAALPPCPDQQLIFHNTSSRPFAGYVDFEPWIGYLWATKEPVPCRLTDQDGTPVPSQRLHAEAAFNLLRLTARLEIPAGQSRILRIRHDREAEVTPLISASADAISSAALMLRPAPGGIDSLMLDGRELLRDPLRTAVITDHTDTWSHGIDRYGLEPVGEFTGAGTWSVRENGPLVAALVKPMSYEASSLLWETRVNAGENIIRLSLRLNWNDRRKLVKLLIAPNFHPLARVDGCPGGHLSRRLDGEEYPFHDFLALEGADHAMAVVSRDVFAADVQPDGTIRLTLLRSPYYAHHDPFVVPADSTYPVCDQGEHEYRISLLPQKKIDLAAIAAEADRQTQPVWFSETTLGCGRK